MASDHVGRLTEQALSELHPLLWPSAIDRVPAEMALTNREVLLLVYGLAAGGERDVPRSAYRECWDRGESYSAAGRDEASRAAGEVCQRRRTPHDERRMQPQASTALTVHVGAPAPARPRRKPHHHRRRHA